MDATDGFRVFIPGQPAAADVFGLWQAAPGDEPATVWEVDVAANTEQARALLQKSSRRVSAAARAIPAAQSRLQRFQREAARQEIAFAAPAPGRAEPERRLAAAMAPEVESFALGGLGDQLEQALRQATRFSDQVRRTVGQPALVKSRAAGRPLGQTRVGWSGDVRTTWGPGLGPAEAAVHEQAVHLALATFQAWLRIATFVGAATVQLSLLLPSGIGAIRALPAAWNFITDILDEYQRLRDLST